MADGTHLKTKEEAWIAKYRAALENVPVEEPRFKKISRALKSFRKAASSGIEHIQARLKNGAASKTKEENDVRVGLKLVMQPPPVEAIPPKPHSGPRRSATERRSAKKEATATKTLRSVSQRKA